MLRLWSCSALRALSAQRSGSESAQASAEAKRKGKRGSGDGAPLFAAEICGCVAPPSHTLTPLICAPGRTRSSARAQRTHARKRKSTQRGGRGSTRLQGEKRRRIHPPVKFCDKRAPCSALHRAACAVASALLGVCLLCCGCDCPSGAGARLLVRFRVSVL